MGRQDLQIVGFNVCYTAILQYTAVCFLDEAIIGHTHDDNGLYAVCPCLSQRETFKRKTMLANGP